MDARHTLRSWMSCLKVFTGMNWARRKAAMRVFIVILLSGCRSRPILAIRGMSGTCPGGFMGKGCGAEVPIGSSESAEHLEFPNDAVLAARGYQQPDLPRPDQRKVARMPRRSDLPGAVSR
jgi:hypothetical protein